MKKSTSQMLQLFFNRGEHICVSPNKYGYHSVEQQSLISDIVLQSPNPDFGDITVCESDINMMAINPIQGFRSDKNVTAYRSFLVEIDDGPLPEQKAYIESMKMPYSICIFSGNKSLHYGIVLSEDLPDYNTWKVYAEWILAVMNKADPMTKNPSRSIRFPNNKRHDGKQLLQSLVDIKDRVSLNKLNIWLHQYPQHKPKPPKPPAPANDHLTHLDIPDWIIGELEVGIFDERNNMWFKMAAALTKKGFGEAVVFDILEPYYVDQSDFKHSEWITAIKHGIKTGQGTE